MAMTDGDLEDLALACVLSARSLTSALDEVARHGVSGDEFGLVVDRVLHHEVTRRLASWDHGLG